jgi:hypothetical protein
MKISKIVIAVDADSIHGHQKVEDVVLDGTQGSLVPNVGDRYMAPGFSMNVGKRKFEFTDDSLFVYLVSE